MDVVQLGKPVRFLIPPFRSTDIVEGYVSQVFALREFHKFLAETFRSYTGAGPVSSFVGHTSNPVEMSEFCVVIQEGVLHEKLALLQRYLADYCRIIGAESIYMEVGDAAMRVYPDRR